MVHISLRLLVLVLMPLLSYSQNNKVLCIGDTLPSMQLNHIFNEPGNSIFLKEYRGKLIILDFWNKWCRSCIEAFPKMEKLQNEFGDKIKILLVTSDIDKDLEKLFSRVKKPALPIISNDTLLNAMFPHATVPHHVWVGPGGRVEFITEGYNTTAKNISKFMGGSSLELQVKSEVNDFDSHAPLWKEGNGRLQRYITSYSFGMTRINENEATRWQFNKDTINKTSGFKFVNIPLLDLYRMAFANSIYHPENYPDNRIIFDLSEGNTNFKRPVVIDSLADWKEENFVCYESKWNILNERLAYQYLQNDINRFFPYKVAVEEREVNCYVLFPCNTLNDLTAGNKEKIFEYSDSLIRLENMPLSSLLLTLNELQFLESTPVLSEIPGSAIINVNLRNAFGDITTLKRELFKNGFSLLPVKKKINMLVISKK